MYNAHLSQIPAGICCLNCPYKSPHVSGKQERRNKTQTFIKLHFPFFLPIFTLIPVQGSLSRLLFPQTVILSAPYLLPPFSPSSSQSDFCLLFLLCFPSPLHNPVILGLFLFQEKKKIIKKEKLLSHLERAKEVFC